MKKMNKKGFTIVELVIVIAVIAILSAVLIPTFSGVIEDANKTAAVANAKAAYQEYIGMMMTEGKVEENLIYSDGKYYVAIKDGQMGDAYESEAAAAKEVLNLTKETPVKDTDYTVTAVTIPDGKTASNEVTKLSVVAVKPAA